MVVLITVGAATKLVHLKYDVLYNMYCIMLYSKVLSCKIQYLVMTMSHHIFINLGT